MDRTARSTLALAGALAGLLLGGPARPGSAQEAPDPDPGASAAEGTFRVDARGGIAVPTADMRDFVDEGPVAGAGLAYLLTERVALRADWTAALMRRADRRPLRSRGVEIPERGSETDLHHLTGGVQVELSEPGEADVEVRTHASAGVTFLSTEETELAVGGNFTQLTVNWGVEIAVPMGAGFRIFGRGDIYMLPTRSGAPPHLLKEVTLPFSAGVSWQF